MIRPLLRSGVWLLLPLLSLPSCSTRAERWHLLERAWAQYPGDLAETRTEVDVLEDLGTVALRATTIRILYLSFSWSTSDTGWRHQTNKLLLFESPDLYIGQVYLHEGIDRAQSQLRDRVLKVAFDGGEQGEVAFADGQPPEPRGSLKMGLFHPGR